MSKRALVVGSNSLLAYYLESDDNVSFIRRTHKELDITSYRSIVDNIEDSLLEEGDFVVNCAAWTDVAKAELKENAESVRLINEVGPKYLAEACAHYGLNLIHISTDYVYDGEQNASELGMGNGGYIHSVPIDAEHEKPLNRYGETKLLGEKNILSIKPQNFTTILRTSSLYGENGRKKTFLHRILNKALAKEIDRIETYSDQYASFTYAKDLANWISSFIKYSESNPNAVLDFIVKYGRVVNVVNSKNGGGGGSPYCFAKMFLESMALERLACKLVPTAFPKDNICPDGVARPKNATLCPEASLDIDCSKELPNLAMPTFDNALKRFCLKNYNDLLNSAKASICLNGKRFEEIY